MNPLETNPRYGPGRTRSGLRWSALAPLACAVHCGATPILAATLPVLAAAPGVEWGFLGATLLFGGIAFPRHPHVHRDLRPVSLLLFGIALWTASLLQLLGPLPQDFTTACASLAAAVGLFWLSRARHRSCVSAG
jgi:hypothetical protein